MLSIMGAGLVLAMQGVPIAVGNFETATLPPLIKVDRLLPHATMTKRVEEILAKGECTLEGQSATNFDLVIPYAVLLQSDGAISKVVVHDTGCQPLTQLVAEVVVSQAGRGDFVPPDPLVEQWFGSDVYFKNAQVTVSEARADPDKVSCRSSPKLGSRLSVNRTCKTAAEWRQYDKDREQLRRDVGAAAVCHSATCTIDGGG